MRDLKNPIYIIIIKPHFYSIKYALITLSCAH